MDTQSYTSRGKDSSPSCSSKSTTIPWHLSFHCTINPWSITICTHIIFVSVQENNDLESVLRRQLAQKYQHSQSQHDEPSYGESFTLVLSYSKNKISFSLHFTQATEIWRLLSRSCNQSWASVKAVLLQPTWFSAGISKHFEPTQDSPSVHFFFRTI